MPRLALAMVLAIAAALSTQDISGQRNRTDEIVARAVSYVTEFVGRFAGLVAEEHYVQDSRTVPSSRGRQKGGVIQATTAHREIKSDFLFVAVPGVGSWRMFRDVREVDGRPVRDRDERLTTLFLQPSGTPMEQVEQIDREAVRYNLGDGTRTLNNPLLVLGFLQTAYQQRFRFAVRDLDADVGPDVWIVAFKEQARPTILRQTSRDGGGDHDLVATGRLWIEGKTGRVVKTELTVSDSDEVTTTFRFDERFQVALPEQMRESYWANGQYVSTTATYGSFRQFAVHTEEKLKQ